MHPLSTLTFTPIVDINKHINNIIPLFHNLKKFRAFYQSNFPPYVQKEISKNVSFGTTFRVAKKLKKVTPIRET